MKKIVQHTLEVEHEGSTWVGEWCSFITRNNTETTDRWLKVARKEADGTLTPIEDIHNPYAGTGEEDKHETIIRLLASKRITEIQTEYGIPSESVDELAVAELILARVWAGEWMGQLRNSYYYFIDNLGDVFNKEFLDASEIVEQLGAQKKAGLNGFIIVPWKEEESAYKSWEEATGHKKLNVSDFGGWNCSACGKRGDERDPWAAKVPCVTTEQNAQKS